MSNSDKHADGRINVCKTCILDELDTKDKGAEYLISDDFVSRLKNVLLDMNRPYIHSVWLSSVKESQERGKEPFGVLIKNLNLNHRHKNWMDSEFSEDKEEERELELLDEEERERKKQNLELNRKNEKDVLRLVGYDPFEHEPKEDRPGLYNKLVDYLNEDVLEDGFKLSSVIELVKTFNQVDRINAQIAKSNSNHLSGLISAKEKMLRVAISIAKENGIATGVSKKSGAGSGTFTGIMRQLDDYNFPEAEPNKFDIETSEGIRQVADISNRNIMEQLKFDENDYTEMINEQRALIETYRDQAEKLEEENRLLKIEINNIRKQNERLENELRQG